MARQGIEWDWTHLWSVEASGGGRKYNPGSILEAKNKGVGLVAALFKAVERASIEVRYGTAVRGLKVRQPGGLVKLLGGGREGTE